MQSELTSTSFLIGSYSDGKEVPSIYYFDSQHKNAKSIFSAINPSYLATYQGYIYAVSEQENGVLITLDPNFNCISKVSTKGHDPCQVTISQDGKHVVVVNYSSASVLVYELENHIPIKITTFLLHEGSSIHPERQTCPHPHSTVFSHDGKILFVADLGTDIVYYYNFNGSQLSFEKDKSIKMTGCGPRTLTLGSPESKRLYLSCELDSSVRVLTYVNDKLELLMAYQISQNPNNFLSEIKYFKKVVFVALRGDNKIMIFDEKENELVQRCSFAVGNWPRHFAVTQEGHLIVACQKENLIQKYMMKDDKIYMLSEMVVDNPSIIVPYTMLTKSE